MGVLGNIILFTLVEGVAFFGGVALWFTVSPVAGTAFWLGFTLVEHIFAYNVGAGKPILSLPKF